MSNEQPSTTNGPLLLPTQPVVAVPPTAVTITAAPATVAPVAETPKLMDAFKKTDATVLASASVDPLDSPAVRKAKAKIKANKKVAKVAKVAAPKKAKRMAAPRGKRPVPKKHGGRKDAAGSVIKHGRGTAAVVFTFRTTLAQAKAIKRAVKKSGLSLSAWIRKRAGA